MRKFPISLQNRKKTNIILLILFIIFIIAANSGMLLYQTQYREEFLIYMNDVDRLGNGNTAIRVGEFQTALKIMGNRERVNCYSTIFEVNPAGDIVWQYTPDDPGKVHPDHEIKKMKFKGNMGYFFTDCLVDKVRFVDYNTKQITWDYWLGDVNWTQINSSWDEDHYYNHPEYTDWSHLNDIDFKNYSTWESMLLSIRDFNLVVEVNFTRAQDRAKANASDIVWWYGGDDILGCQHNPEYLPNGNILIVDSDHQRIIEVNYTTKEIEWDWTDSTVVNWPRDCDLMPDGVRYLITDIGSTYILNRTSNEIELVIGHGGYEADYIEASNTIILGGDTNGKLGEFDADTGEVVWTWGKGGVKIIADINLSVIVVYETILVVYFLLTVNSKKKLKIAVMTSLMVLEITVLFNFQFLHDFFFVRAIC